MSCPNCGSNNTWDDNMHWGCNQCKWCSLAGLNSTRTPSNPNNRDELEQEIKNLKQQVKDLKAVIGKECWYWQNDGQDYPESLTCPVVIKAGDLKQILRAAQDKWLVIDWSNLPEQWVPVLIGWDDGEWDLAQVVHTREGGKVFHSMLDDTIYDTCPPIFIKEISGPVEHFKVQK